MRIRLKFVAAVVVAVLSLVVAVVVVKKSRRNHPTSEPQNEAPAAESLAQLDESNADIQTTLPSFHRLSEHYIRGSEPARGGVTVLARLGVKTLIDLRSRYDHTTDVAVTAEKLGLRYHWLPMSVWDPPSDELANHFVSLINDKDNTPVFVFCADGLNRTGEMSAIYRVASDNWSVEQALAEIDRLGFNPYYWSLRNYVWTYARKFRPSSLPRTAQRISVLEK